MRRGSPISRWWWRNIPLHGPAILCKYLDSWDIHYTTFIQYPNYYLCAWQNSPSRISIEIHNCAWHLMWKSWQDCLIRGLKWSIAFHTVAMYVSHTIWKKKNDTFIFLTWTVICRFYCHILFLDISYYSHLIWNLELYLYWTQCPYLTLLRVLSQHCTMFTR